MSLLETIWAWTFCTVALIGGVSCILAPFALRYYARELERESKERGTK